MTSSVNVGVRSESEVAVRVSEALVASEPPLALSARVTVGTDSPLSCGRGDALAEPELMSNANRPIAKIDATPKRTLAATAMNFWHTFLMTDNLRLEI